MDRSEQVQEIEGSIAEIQSWFQREAHAADAHRRLSRSLIATSGDRWIAAKLFAMLLLVVFLVVLFFF